MIKSEMRWIFSSRVESDLSQDLVSVVQEEITMIDLIILLGIISRHYFLLYGDINQEKFGCDIWWGTGGSPSVSKKRFWLVT